MSDFESPIRSMNIAKTETGMMKEFFLFQKHLGLTLDNRLTFHKYLRYVSNKISKTIELLRNLHNIQGQHFLQYINVSGGSMCNLSQST